MLVLFGGQERVVEWAKHVDAAHVHHTVVGSPERKEKVVFVKVLQMSVESKDLRRKWYSDRQK